jgi:hypothetical protein
MDIHLDCRLEIIRAWVVAHVPTQCLKQARGGDLAEWLVRSGLALDWPQYSKGAYAAAQLEGRACEPRNVGRQFPRTLGGSVLQTNRLLAVPISHCDVRFTSHCRRNADIASCPKSTDFVAKVENLAPKNLAKVDLWTSLLLRRFSTPLRRCVIDFG